MSEVKFDCPSCGQPIETAEVEARRGLNCPSCYKFFTPKIPASAPEPNAIPDVEAKHLAKLKNRREQIRTSAELCSLFAKITFFLGLASLVISLFVVFGEGNPTIGFILGASLIGTAFWLYLIAQIIHIRANTLNDK